MHPSIPPWLLVPFALMLLSVAILPLATPHWWEKNRNKLVVSLILGLPVALLLMASGHGHALADTLVFEYLPFLVLLGSLYIISGGILVTGNLVATPLTNVLFLATGAVLASLMGTTGAAMLLIRPFLATNRERTHKVHSVVFFIFLVCNIGGSLTPIGDPPLFLGYLMGVPFFWTLRLAPAWGFTSLVLLAVYFVWDTLAYRREPLLAQFADRKFTLALRADGKINFLFLGGVVASVVFLNHRFLSWIPAKPDPFVPAAYLSFVRELAMISLAGLSLAFTKKEFRKANEFSLHPMAEVSALFLGIFVTMVPALLYLSAHTAALTSYLSKPGHFFWGSGILSSFLDNAPTYVTFFTAAGIQADRLADFEPALVAISLGSVFMGANTYIGNGPNFMVRSIAESSGVRMPSFFGFMAYSSAILLPLFILVQLIFV